MEKPVAAAKSEPADALASPLTADAIKPVVRPSPSSFSKWPRDVLSLAVMGLFLLGAVGFLYVARTFFLPVVLALMLSFLFRPVVRALAKIKVPVPIGAAIVLVAALFAVGNGVSRLAQPASEWMAQAPEILRDVQHKFRHLLRPAAQLNQAAAQVQDITQGTAGSPTPKVELRRFSFLDMFLSHTTSFLMGAIETLVLLYFLLTSGDLLLQKVVKVLPRPYDKQQAAEITREVQHNISTFLFTITLINMCLGVLVGFGLFLVGMPNPVLWGVMAGLLNFIPYFGPLIGSVVLIMAGLVTYDSLGGAVVPAMLYLSMHALESNFITPMILGRRLTLNPLVIFVALMFWTWMWGIPGALLAVPLLMTFKIFCDHVKPLTSVGELLSD